MASVASLNLYTQKNHIAAPVYSYAAIDSFFNCTVSVEVDGKSFKFTSENYPNKKSAKESAAEGLLTSLISAAGEVSSEVKDAGVSKIKPPDIVVKLEDDYVSLINMNCQKNKLPPPLYRFGELAPGKFTCTIDLFIDGGLRSIDTLPSEVYSSKRDAKSAAARLALDAVRISGLSVSAGSTGSHSAASVADTNLQFSKMFQGGGIGASSGSTIITYPVKVDGDEDGEISLRGAGRPPSCADANDPVFVDGSSEESPSSFKSNVGDGAAAVPSLGPWVLSEPAVASTTVEEITLTGHKRALTDGADEVAASLEAAGAQTAVDSASTLPHYDELLEALLSNSESSTHPNYIFTADTSFRATTTFSFKGQTYKFESERDPPKTTKEEAKASCALKAFLFVNTFR